ncbi:MAG: lipoyl(octanoyl) transferase LipB, partial [Bacteroidota bacterium]
YQEAIFNEIIEYKIGLKEGKSDSPPPHHLIFVEHPHVFTLGKSGSENNLLLNHIQLQAEEASFYHTNRGGDITYHGPGQIVGYPILSLEELRLNLKTYIHKLEESVIKAISFYGIEGERLKGSTGVWLDADVPGKARKICAIGVRASRYVTMHGFALNINTDLKYFSYINPCGFIDKKVTSVEAELGRNINFEEAKAIMKKSFEEVFSFRSSAKPSKNRMPL